ncbi:MAG: hypothetical protein KDB07_07055 [Planctomycetes bacterium]|nr:hypothetical protein [Planctomycetota bacterium]
MPKVRYNCSSCHSVLDAEVVQFDEDGVAAWCASYLCEECGQISERDEGAQGLPSDDLRIKLLRAEGNFALRIEGSISEREFQNLLAEAFAASDKRASVMIEDVCGIAFRGTREECELLERALQRDGVAARVERA